MLSRLEIHNVRNLSTARLSSLPRVAVFAGPNGSGKTSLLEAIHLLGLARSFRSTRVKTVIQHGQPSLTVFGEVAAAGSQRSVPLGVQRTTDGELILKCDGEPLKTVAALAEQLPLQVINADSFDLLVGPPKTRRQYLDWGVFHVEHAFLGVWQRYQRALKQRNNLLRRDKIDDNALAPWTNELIQAGEAIDALRSAFFEALEPCFQDVLASLSSGLDGVSLSYRRGWDKSMSLRDALEKTRQADMDQGYTHSGPQRGDVRVMVGQHLAADTLSRGQQKLVVCAMKLAQGRLLTAKKASNSVYLVDDLPSELDSEHCRRVCRSLDELGAQVFITCVDAADIVSVWPEGSSPTVFHVEQGKLA